MLFMKILKSLFVKRTDLCIDNIYESRNTVNIYHISMVNFITSAWGKLRTVLSTKKHRDCWLFS